MPVYWSLKKIPELSGLSRQERAQIYRACARQHQLLHAPVTWRNVIPLFVTALVFFGGLVIIFPVLQLDEYSDSLSALMIFVIAAMSWTILSRFQINYLRPFYSEYVQTELKSGPL
jgi:hypothetical protein